MTGGRTLLMAIDGIDGPDLERLRRSVLPEGIAPSGRLRVLPGGPSEAYPSLVSVCTGTSAGRSGVATDAAFDPGSPSAGLHWYADSLRVPTVFDAAADAGMTTAALQWPATAGSGIDLCLPLVEDLRRYRERWTMARETSSAAMWERHLRPRQEAGVHLSSAPPDALVAEIAAEVLADGRIDLMAVRLAAFADAQRRSGPDSPAARRALGDLADRLQQILEAFSPGAEDRVILLPGRPCVPVRALVHPNAALVAAGLVRTDGPHVTDWDAFVMPDGPYAALHVDRSAPAGTAARALEALAGLAAEHGLCLREVDDGIGATPQTDVVAVLEGHRGTVFGQAATQRARIAGEDPYYSGPLAVTDPDAEVTACATGPGLPADDSAGSWADLGVSIARSMGLALPGATARGLQDRAAAAADGP